jgi:hypothetical protein
MRTFTCLSTFLYGAKCFCDCTVYSQNKLVFVKIHIIQKNQTEYLCDLSANIFFLYTFPVFQAYLQNITYCTVHTVRVPVIRVCAVEILRACLTGKIVQIF